jgi:hypothetical protein
MRRNHTLHTFEALLAALLIGASPALAQDPAGIDTAAGDGSASLVQPALSHGEGAGTITLPTFTTQGLLVGALLEDGGGQRYIVQATLTSFLPGVSGEPAELGGLYGKLLEVDPEGTTIEGKALYVQGTWMANDARTGTLSATLLSNPDVGGPQLIGRIEGKFRLDAPASTLPDFVSAARVKTESKPVRPALDARVEGKRRGAYPPIPGPGALFDVPLGKKRTSGVASDAKSAQDTGGGLVTTDVFLDYVLVQ